MSVRGASSTRSLPYADHVRIVGADQPLHWFRLGWLDLMQAPRLSQCYALIFVVAGLALTVGLWRLQAAYLIIPLASGFMLLGPALTLGFQAISRDLERQERPSFARALLAWRTNAASIFNFGMAFMCFFLLWLRLVEIIFALTFPHSTGLNGFDLLNATFFTIEGLTFLAFFVALGAVMAAVAFAAGAFAVPMLLDRPVGIIEAIGTSFTAVMLNLPTMLVWAAMLVLVTVAGMAVAYVGLAVTLPLAGYATWHAYRAVIRPQET
jgi:uncharacterized membrane protein